jgi:hypothetical protein
MRIAMRSEKNFNRHQKWLTKIAAELRRHYDNVEGPDGSWSKVEAVQFLVRDLFYSEPAAMKETVEQCRDWLNNIHGVKLSPMR